MKKWKQTKYTTWGFSKWFPSLPSPTPLSDAQLAEVHSLHSTLWGWGLDAYTLLCPIDSTLPCVSLLCSMTLNYGSPQANSWSENCKPQMQRGSLLPEKISMINSASPPSNGLVPFRLLPSCLLGWWETLLLEFGTSFHLMPAAPGPTTTSRDGTTSWSESQGKLTLMCSSLLLSSSKNILTLRWALLSWIQGHSHLNKQRSQLTRTRKLAN